jgi:hypothetical protein
MIALAKAVIAGTILISPFAAMAQSNEATYCQALIQAYRNSVPQTADPNAVVPAAIAKCNAGDTATGIPVLEKALKEAKVPLPSRI